MIKTTPLKEKMDALPKSVNFQKDILPTLEKNGITQATFYRDLKAKGSTLPHERLQIYAGLFGCEVADLIDSYVKVKPIVRKTRAGTIEVF